MMLVFEPKYELS